MAEQEEKRIEIALLPLLTREEEYVKIINNCNYHIANYVKELEKREGSPAFFEYGIITEKEKLQKNSNNLLEVRKEIKEYFLELNSNN